ncbi:MAG: 50S ribosomal protein L15 [Acidimicrobiales bacterium]|nr:50S ribosomal protein L15 [Acidimicrobiales bacterium]
MKVHELAPAPGSKRPKRRVARGIGGKGGKTAGRGTKGQKARNNVKLGFEGGQLPLTQRIPKLRGFRNPFQVRYNVINLDDLMSFQGNDINPDTLRQVGLLRANGMVKILGRGSAPRAFSFKVHAISASARQSVEAAGGTVEILPPPFGNGRPAASGNALSNR